MAATFLWASYPNLTQNTGLTSISVGSTNALVAPGTITAGDILFVAMCVGTTAGTDPGTISVVGFTSVYNTFDSFAGFRYYWGWKLAGAGETGIYVASWSAACNVASWMEWDIASANSSPIDTSSAQLNDSFTTNMVAASCSPTGSNDLLLGLWMGPANNPFTVDPSMVLCADMNSDTTGAPEILLASQQLSASGATGTRTATMTTFGSPSVGILIAITPSGAGPVITKLINRNPFVINMF